MLKRGEGMFNMKKIELFFIILFFIRLEKLFQNYFVQNCKMLERRRRL